MRSRVEARVKEDEEEWRWCMVRVLVEEGLYHLYTYETEKANPYFMRAMKCEWCDDGMWGDGMWGDGMGWDDGMEWVMHEECKNDIANAAQTPSWNVSWLE